VVEIVSPEDQGWYDPSTGQVIFQDHRVYYQYNITDIPEPFIQEEGKIYWLELCMDVADPEMTRWGWKSSEDHWNDDAVWRGEIWRELFEPSEPMWDDFWAQVDFDYVFGGGSGFDDGFWFYYENTGWWNQWFYDGVFDPERFKVVTIMLDIDPYIPGWIEIALNYSTPWWSELGRPYPPIPPLTPPEEELYIERVTLLEGDIFELMGHHELGYVIQEYNPEWVSIDIRTDGTAAGFIVGEIVHDCVQSLDLAFVITGGCPGDIDGDGETGQADLGILLSCWGCCVGDSCWDQGSPPCSAADLDGDGCVGQGDLGILLADWGCGTGP
jgi:hypothetical protein